MSMMEEFLELQETVEKLRKSIKEKEAEVETKNGSISQLKENINTLTNEAVKATSDIRHFRSMISVLESDKKNLERERDRFLKDIETLNIQIKQFANMVETTNQSLQIKEEMMLSKEKQLQTKDLLIVEKDEKLEAYRKRFEELSEAKEQYQAEKFAFMEQLSQEKIALVEKVGGLEKQIEDRERKVSETKAKLRTAQDGLLGTSMDMEKIREETTKLTIELQEAASEIDRLREENDDLRVSGGLGSEEDVKSRDQLVQKLKQNAEDIEKYKERITLLELKLKKFEEKSGKKKGGEEEIDPEVFEHGTGSYNSVSTLIAHFRFKMDTVDRTLRIILPDLSFIEKYALKDTFLGLPIHALKNLACDVAGSRDEGLLEELKRNNWKVTDYSDTKLFALTVDNKAAALAVYNSENDSVTGLFSNNNELVKLLSQSIMSPFIKGKKIF